MSVITIRGQCYTRKDDKQGGSLSVGIPAEFGQKLNLSKDDEIKIRKKKSVLPEEIDKVFLDSLSRMLNKYNDTLRNLKDR